MKQLTGFLFAILLFCSCQTEKTASPITGTWQLLTGTTIEQNDTTVTDYTRDKKFLKMINDTHFSFIGHDLGGGADSATAFFTAGGGKYTLTGDTLYTEHLEFCSARDWENHDFTFTVTIHGDTLLQKGMEVVEGSGINRMNIEKYIRVKN